MWEFRLHKGLGCSSVCMEAFFALRASMEGMNVVLDPFIQCLVAAWRIVVISCHVAGPSADLGIPVISTPTARILRNPRFLQNGC